MSMTLPLLIAVCFGVLAPATYATGGDEDPAPRFPAAAPADVGLDPARLEELAAFVQHLTARDEVVGAELLLIRNDKTVLHRAFGWKDREEKIAMEPNTIFCVRSMTKPVAGTAVELLIDEKKLGLYDKVSKHFPSFDNDRSRAITIEQLLHHQGGLPLSGLIAKDPRSIASIREVADAAGDKGPELPPGTRFSYSDDGTDTLGALVELAAGERLETFLQRRVFDPLGMQDAIPIVAIDHPKRARIASNYAGSPQAWTKYWSPQDPPLFSVLLASQSLYCTPQDYARFLALWKDKGFADKKRLVSARSHRRALAPGVDMSYPCGFAGLSIDYGELWMLYVDRTKSKPELVAFGHGGSDGTFAYCFPELDLIALYFTQARGTLSGRAFEAALQQHVIDPLTNAERAPAATYTDAELDAIAGEYWSGEHEELVAFLRRDAKLFVELPGRAILELEATPVKDRWRIALAPSEVFEVERGGDGIARTVLAHSKDPAGAAITVRFEPLTPAPGLPSSEELEALRKRAIDWEKIDALGTCRLSGTIDAPVRKLHAPFTTLASGTTRFRTNIDLDGDPIRVALDGDEAATSRTSTGRQALTGLMLEQTRLDHPFRRIASWKPFFAEMRVLREIDFDGRKAFLVRGRTASGCSRTLYVDAERGVLLAEAFVPTIPGLGESGVLIRYDDWRDVEGIKLPFRVAVEYASPLLGTATSVYEKFETHVEVAEGAFRLEKKP